MQVSNYVQQVTPETPRKGERKLAIRIKACLNCNGSQIENTNYKELLKNINYNLKNYTQILL